MSAGEALARRTLAEHPAWGLGWVAVWHLALARLAADRDDLWGAALHHSAGRWAMHQPAPVHPPRVRRRVGRPVRR